MKREKKKEERRKKIIETKKKKRKKKYILVTLLVELSQKTQCPKVFYTNHWSHPNVDILLILMSCTNPWGFVDHLGLSHSPLFQNKYKSEKKGYEDTKEKVNK